MLTKYQVIDSTHPTCSKMTISVTTQTQQEQFASLLLKPYEVSSADRNDAVPFLSSISTSNRNVVTLNSKGKWCITSYYFDSYGGANITLPLQLQFSSKEEMDSFLHRNDDGISCIQPKPTNLDDYLKQNIISKNKNDVQEESNNEKATNIPPKNVKAGDFLAVLPVIVVEGKVTLTFGTGHAMTSKVETVKIISTYIDCSTNSILFYTNIMVRVSHVENSIVNTTNSTETGTSIDGSSGTTIIDPIEASKMKLNLEIMASYYHRKSVPTTATKNVVDHKSALQLLSSTNYHQQQTQLQGLSSSTSSPIQMKKLVPVPLALNVSLLHTLQISKPRTISHPTIMGMTYIAFTMAHANIHSDPIHVTNIALHPHYSTDHKKKNTLFKWGFVTTTTTTSTKDQSLSSERVNHQNMITNDWSAMTIHPHESQSILISVEQQSSPPSPPIQNILSENGSIIMDNTSFSSHCTLTISTNTMATNTTMPSIATEAVHTTNIMYMATPTSTAGPVATTTTSSGGTMTSDVFHISMSLEQSQPTDENNTSMNYRHSNNIVPLGKPFIVNVDITNLGPHMNQQLKLVVLDPQKHTCRTDSNTTGWQSNDEKQGNDLLMIDTDVGLVHDAMGSHHAAATTRMLRGQLRMIPLRTGTIAIPNFYIMDTGSGNIYYCYHKFQAIVQ
jgi:hypothetical protein